MQVEKKDSGILRRLASRLPKVHVSVTLRENKDSEYPLESHANTAGETLAFIESRIANTASLTSSSRSQRFSNGVQTVLPIVQAMGEAVPLAGGVIKAVAGGLLHLLRTVNRCNKNKEELDNLVQKLERTIGDVDTFPCIRTPAQLKHQQTFVSDMKRLLCKVEVMQKELSPLELGSECFMQEIDGRVKEMDLCLSHYLARCQAENTIHLDSKLDEVLTIQARQDAILSQLVMTNSTRLDIFASSPSPTSGVISLACITIVDAMGIKHQIPLDFCSSYDALLTSTLLLLSNPKYPTTYGRFLKKCVDADRVDLCINTGIKAKGLTCKDYGWEAGTTIVMSIVFEVDADYIHICSGCGSMEWSRFFTHINLI